MSICKNIKFAMQDNSFTEVLSSSAKKFFDKTNLIMKVRKILSVLRFMRFHYHKNTYNKDEKSEYPAENVV